MPTVPHARQDELGGAPSPADSYSNGYNALRYNRRRYATSYKSSGSVSVGNGQKIPLPLTDDYNNGAMPDLPAGVEHYSVSGTQVGLQFPGRGLYLVNYFCGIDTTGSAFDVVCQDLQSYNGYNYTRHLDPALTDRPSRILEFNTIIASDGDTGSNMQKTWMTVLGSGAKVLSAWISAMPL